ncbi:MAG: dihydrolipoamide acetyltransferase family protein [Spirochaetales bacterium]|nr:dihydrolipoamide acetyltransferase family protein [Spirochaetales bacterium]
MATEILLPRQGNSVESCVILEWHKSEGDKVSTGEAVCEVETDKATFEVEAPVDGVFLKKFFEEGDDVPVLTVIAAVGNEGEDVSTLAPSDSRGKDEKKSKDKDPIIEEKNLPENVEPSKNPVVGIKTQNGETFASPRARKTAAAKGINVETLAGSGPGGRVIERDVLAASPSVSLSPAAKQGIASGMFAPERGSGIGGRILFSDLSATGNISNNTVSVSDTISEKEIPIKGVRKVIAERMHSSLQQTAQLTLNSSADARELKAYRQQCKAAPEELGMAKITLNDMILFAVSRVLPRFSYMNAEAFTDKIVEHGNVNLGFAVDTDRGLMVPVIRNAQRLSLKAISAEAKRLGTACLEGNISPDELNGGTFTVSNLGSMGVEHFTPILNAPQVGILGVGGINLAPVQVDGEIDYIPKIALSLTIDHRAVDGAPGAKFLKALTTEIANFRISLAD